MNYYPFHLGDYAAHTAHLEPMEDLAYRRMLDLYYRTESPLPQEPSEIARLIRLRDDAAIVRDVLNEFFTPSDDGWRHGRCDAEIATYRAMSDGGRKGAAKRWGKPSDSPPIAPLSPPHRTPNANQNQNQNQKNIPPPPSAEGGAFAAFWDEWPQNPRKVARKQCAAKWAKLRLDGIASQVMAALKAAKVGSDWRKNSGEFIPSPLVWLNQQRWEAPTEAQAAAQQQATCWHETRSGIEAKAMELGLERWDERLAQIGSGEQFHQYRAKVYALAGFNEGAKQ